MIDSNRKKVVDFDKYRVYKKIEKEIPSDELENLEEIYRKMRDLFLLRAQETLDSHIKKRIIELEKENKDMENKLRKSFPVHIITYLTICSFVMGVCITLLVLTYLYDICLINPYYIICTLLISLTLLCTAAVATKDWKDYISGK